MIVDRAVMAIISVLVTLILIYFHGIFEPKVMFRMSVIFIIVGAIVVSCLQIVESKKSFNYKLMIRGIKLLLLSLSLGLGVLLISCLAG